MKKILSVLALFFMCSAIPAQASEYIEAQGGLATNSWGIRGGRYYQNWDLSIGYFKSERYDVDFHTLSLEAYYTKPISVVMARIGGGVGFTIPNFPTGPETGDNGHSWSIGGGVEYKISKNWSTVAMLRGLFFTTDTQKTTYGSHKETLSNGQGVDVLDVFHEYVPRQFNSILFGVSIRYVF